MLYLPYIVMNDYRRPSRQQPDVRRSVDGISKPQKSTPPTAKTNTPNPLTQPHRAREIEAVPAPAHPIKPVKHPLIDMSLPDDETVSAHQTKRRRLPKMTAKRSAALAVCVVFVAVGILGAQGLLNLNKVFRGTAKQAASLQTDVNPTLLKGEGDGRINILLTGVGGGQHAGRDLTDTLMLASIDPVNGNAALLSVPRDLWVTLPGKGSMKINAAYATAKAEYVRRNKAKPDDPKAISAGFTSIDQTIEQVLGVPVHYNLLVNFQAFRQAVDTVGGVTVNAPADLYDPTMAWENNKNPYLARQGAQTFDGVHALIYARSRETSSDFARSERQRAVLLALKQKAVSLGVVSNPTKLSRLLGAFGNNVQTDLSLGDATRLYSIFKGINNSSIQSVSLAGTTSTTSSGAGDDSLVTTGTINGQSIVMPKDGLENYDDIQEYVRGKLRDGYITKEKAKVLVINGTVESGLAQRTADKLKTYGYNVVGTSSTETEIYENTIIIDRSNGKKKYTKNYLEQRYNTTAVKTIKDTSITPGTADFVVLLGGDEAGTE